MREFKEVVYLLVAGMVGVVSVGLLWLAGLALACAPWLLFLYLAIELLRYMGVNI